MRFVRGLGFQAATFAAALVMPALAQAQNCNLTNPPCSGTPACAGACAGSITVNTLTQNMCTTPGPGQSFDLTATPYRDTCHGTMGLGGSSCATTARVPPFRFWGLDAYKTANSGCQDLLATNGAGNGALDLGGFTTPPPNGHWFLFGTDWFNGGTDGCVLAAGSPPVVVEASEPFPSGFPAAGSGETTINHGSWYVIISVPFNGSSYDVDAVTNVPNNPNCPGGKDVPSAPVGTALVGGRTAATNCRNDTTPTTSKVDNGVNANFFDVAVTLETPSPQWYTENGPGASPNLIIGHQVVYAKGAEPTSSNYFTGGWTPVLDPADPTRARAPIAVGTAGPVTISLPKGSPPDMHWLATRLVYQDTSFGQVVPLANCTVGTNCPMVVSDVSSHCGPVQFGTVVQAVDFVSVEARRTGNGVEVSWLTRNEDDVLGYKVFRASNPAGTDAEALSSTGVPADNRTEPYTATDSAAALNATIYYYVQEFTSNGAGSRSQSVRVDPQAASSGRTPGSTGGRSRSRRGR